MTHDSSIQDALSDFTVSTESLNPKHFEAAIALWKKDRSTLGLFPRGAFEDHANKNWIMYLLSGEELAGYLLYRIAKERAVIVHLCIGEDYRGKGAAKVLFNHFRTHIEDGHCRGIEVKCRGDYEIAPIWSSLGFEFVKAERGRGEKPTELVKWFFRFDVDDFFYDLLPKQEDDDLVWAVLDANIIFKLNEPNNPYSQEACALMSETIASYSKYMISPEILSEIERKKDQRQRNESHTKAKEFERIQIKRADLEYYINLLKPIWTNLSARRDQSDLKHVAYTAASGIRIFITQDKGLLDKAEIIRENVDINVMCPADYISKLYELEEESRYVPSSIARSDYSKRASKADEIPYVAALFTNVRDGEKRRQFEAKLRSAVSAVETHETMLILNGSGDYLMLAAWRKSEEELSIEILRHDKSQLAEALTQNWVWGMLSHKTGSSTTKLNLCDSCIPPETLGLFSQRGFIKSENGLSRTAFKSATNLDNFIHQIESLAESDRNIFQPILERLEQNPELIDYKYEEVFWPLKLLDLDVPTFLVPIKPVWAKDLFDEDLASQDLFGADPKRFFNWENVYYRSAKKVQFKQGSRILWYVSQNKNMKISQIRACSRLLSHEIDSAKNLFKKFRRLGIYEWRDLMNLTRNDPNSELMAIRFYQTECFKKPIPLKDFSLYDIKTAPMSPTTLSSAQFNSLYRAGMKIND